MTASFHSAQANGTQDSGTGIRKKTDEGIVDFTSLDAWKAAHDLTLKIYRWTASFPDTERYGLVSQMRRAAVSIESNLAEGFGRFHPDDKKKFYIMARASCTELQCQIMISRDLLLLASENAKEGLALSKKVQQMINGLIRSMRNIKANPHPASPIPNPESRIPNPDVFI